MALSIHTNYSALTTNTALNKSNSSLATNQQRLGTGLRINSAADDAAGLQIATRLNAQSRGMGVAMRNTGDATSMLQTAEGAFSEMTDITQRMKDLATQAANGTNGVADLKSIQSEYDELGKELLNIFKNTKYAGEGLFSNGTTNDGATGKFGLAAGVTFQIGSSASETMVVNASAKLGTLATNLGAASAIFTANGAAAVGTEIATITAGPPETAVNNANASITKLETVLNSLGEVRAQFGSSINRLNHVNNNLANMKDNTEMAKGRIMDADFAIESANMSKNSMLMQSGISMLKQAGQMPGMVMGLLG
ncbi:MAG: lateral flagellin LafA [Gammaproteobacteria bacterium]|jgi:flagellin|uniref:lateral flagellin LafA n=1 Tax=Pseudomonadaceae TaxID=135621 RepID=UPI000E98E755|nr:MULTISPECIES: lateral flagellin LafA [Pseudomonadaceae]MBU0813317.1 lateral flagellin LafA [Gammaproteobacteria bacterium]HAW22336.1 Lateral flagellin [Pseudomonas sp.]MBK3849801.1 Lateral flagellin [Stutzerimonas xanthomarina]MBU0853527.1 lateral flagellin LafA [Gammaproteobacteria bacterium]MBU1300601.1 lateral flagellin LafA [Gammaproteobacteria bacterium]|tara:strand:- start:52204 stop:53130 length:927 start_codon:yes stop_codon:yes gene_type:complete